jgi:hypothetical protein
MKTIVAMILAAAFLASTPTFAADKDDSGKAGSSGKKSKGDKADKGGKKDDAPAKTGGGW